MNFFSLISVELKKIKRSKILLILLVQLFQTVGTYWTTHSDKRLSK